MDTVEYMSASGEFAIMRRGKSSKTNAEKELEKLLDMRPESSKFAEKQLRPFLEEFGRHFGRSSDLLIRGEAEESEECLSRLGYSIQEVEGTCEKLVSANGGGGNHASRGTYIANIDSIEPNPLMRVKEELHFVAELGLLSQGYESRAVALVPTVAEGTATYTLRPPHTLALNLQEDEEGQQFAHLQGTVGSRNPLQGTVGSRNPLQGPGPLGELVESYEGGRAWVLKLSLPEGEPNERKLAMLAAGQLLSLIEERYYYRPKRFVVDPDTLKLVPNDVPYLIGELIACIASGSVHPCFLCGRPLMGRTWYCRGRRCKASDLEDARHLAAQGYEADFILDRYPHIKRATIEGYIEDERREVL